MRFRSPPVGFTKSGPEPPGKVWGSSSQAWRRVNSPFPQLSDVGGEGGRTGGRAARARNWAAGGGTGSARSRPLFASGPRFRAEGSTPPPAKAPSPALERGVLLSAPRSGSAARLGGRAGVNSQVKLLLSPCEAWSTWKMPRRDGRSRRRLQPPAAAPLPFRFH